MKRIFTFLILISVSVLTLNAQSFLVYDHNDVLINDQTIVIPTEAGGAEIFYYWDVVNNTASQKDVKILMTLQTTQIDESSHSICTTDTEESGGQCAFPWSATSPTVELNAGERMEEGDFRFIQGPNGGVTTILYKFYDVNNESDFITFTVTYSTLTSVMFAEEDQFTVFPNPAVNSFVISNEYGAGSYVEIYNVLGMQVDRVDFSNMAETEVDCSSWEKGYYFCRLYNNGKVEKTIKITVTK